MASSKTPQDDTDEETIAFRKKRSLRRVSFADREITSVHIFKRDEDYETPPKPPDDSPLVAPPSDEHVVLGFFKDLAVDSEEDEDSRDFSPNENDDDDDDDDDDDEAPARSFLRPIESPGSSSFIGSATSNDDNFFGPVSADFIRPGRLSDSAASNDNHDITMDSTAFSMHFRSLAGSESGGDLATATGVRLAFEEKTPSGIRTPTDSGSFMALTKPIHHIPKSSLLAGEISHNMDSNDMSLVGVNPHKYDYAKLSPGLEALLAEGSKDLHVASVSSPSNLISPKIGESSAFREIGNGHRGQLASRDQEKNNVSLHDISGEGVSLLDRRFSEANGGKPTTDFDLISHDCLVNANEIPVTGGIQTPNQLNKMGLIAFQDSGRQSSIEDYQKENFPIKKRLSPHDNQISQLNESPLSSISSLSAKRRQIFHTANSPKHSLYMTPTKQQGSLNKQNPKQGDVMISIQKSSSKVSNIKPSPSLALLQEKLETSSLRVTGYLSSNASPFNTIKHLDLPVVNLEDRLHGAATKSADTIVTVNMKNDAIGAEKDTEGLGHDDSAIIEMNSPTDLNQEKTVNYSGIYSPKRQNGFETFRNFRTPSKDVTNIEYKSGSAIKNLGIPADGIQSTEELPRDEIQVASRVYTSPYADRSSLQKLSQILTKSELSRSPRLKQAARSPSRIPLHSQLHDDSAHSFDGRGIPSYPQKSDEHSDKASYQERDLAKSSGLKRKNRDMDSRDTECEDEISRVEKAGKLKKSDTHDEVGHSNGRNSREVETACDKAGYQEHELIRTNREIESRDTNCEDEISRVEKTGKVQKTDTRDIVEHSNGRNSREEETACSTGSKDWNDISSKFSSDTSQLHSSQIAKISTREASKLEDILVHLQKVNGYEILRSNILSQESNGHSSNKRVSEIRLLLNKVVYEKAKLQLMCAKREMLLSKVKPLSSGIEQMQTLKKNITRFFRHGERTTGEFVNGLDSGFVNSDGNHQAASEKVTIKRRELEALDRKVKILTESLSSNCKMKGEPSCSDSVTLLKSHLKQRAVCRLIRQDLQLWEVNDLENNNNRHSVVLNYLGLISQRFTINAGLVSSIIISNKLNDINITKNFPNMDAFTAFSFVLRAERTKTYSGFKSLTQETQSTSSLLRNLLDVAQEVQVAQTQIRNLTHMSFNSPSVEQLDLQLVFLDFSSGRKVTITLDLTCLKCGIYPSEILPCKIQVSTTTTTTMTESSKPDSLSVDTKVATDSLRVGYPRILKLCECVSHVVQSESR
ncbi:hypothetical protein ACFE04_000488 [Oxalis oulophora]